MKNPVLIFLIISSLLVAACSVKGTRNPLLIEADLQLHTGADSMNILSDSTAELSDRADSALYAVLCTETGLGIGLTFADDSLICTAIDYYAAANDRDLWARGLVCRALIRLHNGNSVSALRDVLQAEDLHANDVWVRHRIAYTLGQINLSAGCYHYAVDAFERAVLLADDYGKDNKLQMLSRCKLAQAYDKCGLRDSFDRCVTRISRLGKHADKTVAAEVDITLAQQEIYRGNLKQAQAYLLRANMVDLSRRSSYLLGNIYAQGGDIVAAEREWYDAAASFEYDIRLASIDSLMSHRKGDIFVSDLYIATTKQSTAWGTSDEIAAIQEAHRRQKSQAHTYRIIVTALSVTSVLLLALLLFVVYHRRKVQLFRRRLTNANRQYLYDLEAYGKAKQDIDRLKARITQYQEEEQMPQKWNIEEMLLAESPVIALHAQASRGREATDRQWYEVQQLIAERDPALTALLAGNTDINAREQHVCMLVRLRFIPGEMSALLGMSPQAITNLRMRLLTKLFGVKGGARLFDEMVRNVGGNRGSASRN